MTIKRFALGMLATGLFTLPASAQQRQAPPELGSMECGDLANHFGPFDYRKADLELRTRVESFHFTPQVEQLRAGQSTMHIGGDIAYTLAVFPNHPRALQSISRLAVREKRDKPLGASWSVDCYFERAQRFQPQDPNPPLLYGMHLIRIDRPRDAIRVLQRAMEVDPTSVNAAYNLGLAYFDVKDYDSAAKYAKAAYDAGWPLPGLRNKLKQVGRWRE